ncbi:response regulator [Larkinella harenae]
MLHPHTKKSANQIQNEASILVIEDNPDQWQLIRQAIKTTFTNAKPVWATNQQQALAYLDDCITIGLKKPLLVLLDLYLPEREMGWNLLQQIRTMPPPISLLPIVLLSSSSHGEDITESYERGITSYVVKPTEFESWIETFQTLKEYWIDTAALPDRRTPY